MYSLTLVDVDNVGVLDGGHDLDLPPDPDEVRLRLNLALLDRLDRNLGEIVDRNEELRAMSMRRENDRHDGPLRDSNVRRFFLDSDLCIYHK
jgi:hypothetical protein